MQKLLTTSAVFFAFFISLSSSQAQDKAKKPVASASKEKASAKKAKPTKKTKGKVKPGAGKKNPSGSKAKTKKAPKKTARQLKREAKQAAEESARQYEEAVKKLESGIPNTILEGVQALGETGKKEAAAPLMTLLKTGPRSDITDATLFALGEVGNDDAVPLLLPYLNHRRPDARIAALFSLEKLKGEAVTQAIETALRDSDRQVRASAALVLGKRGDVRSVPILFTAFERGVTDATIAIGQLGSPDDAKRLLSYLGKENVQVLLSGFEEFLHREEFPENAKLNILNRLFDLAGPEVKRFAESYKESFPPDTKEEENKIYRLVCRMARQIKDK